MAHVGSFVSRPHAEMAARMLDAHGIPATVIGDDAGGAAPHFLLGSGGGYTLDVVDADRQEADDLLHVDESGGDTLIAADRPTSTDARVLTMRVVAGALLSAVVVSIVLSLG